MQDAIAILEDVILPTFESKETFSYEQFVRFLREQEKLTDLFRCELLDGRIHMSPPAGWLHATVQDNLYTPVSTFVRERRLGRTLGPSAGYRLSPADLVEPDVAFLSNERLAANPPDPSSAFPEIVPDFVIEILSSDRQRDLVEKRAIYQKSGVREYWIVDPEGRSVLQLVRTGERFEERRLASGDRIVSAVIEGFQIDVNAVFDGLP